MAGALALAGASWTVTMTGWVASPIISKLLNEGFSCLGIDMAARIDKLEATILPQFQEVIDAAERSDELRPRMNNWLRRLKKSMYEAEDAIDLYKYRVFQKKVESGGSMMRKISQKALSSISIISPEKVKLSKCLNKLESIALEAEKFCNILGKQPRSNPNNSTKEPMMTTSIPPLRIFGRDDDCDYLLQEMLQPVGFEPESSTMRSYSIHSIVGAGGTGKTTLAQLVYNDERVITAGYDLKIWLSMARGLDLHHHTRMMVEAASKNECPRIDSMDILQDVLINSIKSKKILVVMDDVWWDETMNEFKWEQFVAPLARVERGSIILVTSRTTKMPCVLLPQKIMPLQELEDNHFLSLFMHHAFGGVGPNGELQKNLERVGMQIAKKLIRSPLAAKAVGSRLCKNLDEQFWRRTLESDMLTDTMQSLLWSYLNLAAPIQRCFSYCALFPKGYTFRKEDLILLWVAEGFIHHSGTTRMEDVGEDYFQELLSVFIFQVFDWYGFDRYDMHDLFHDLAERVSQEECFRIDDGTVKEVPPVACHLSIQGENFNEYISSVEKLNNLRTVIFIHPVSDNVIKAFLQKIGKFTKLRVLEFSPCAIDNIPNTVGELLHLRYLCLYRTNVAELPTSVQNLYNLQILRLNSTVTHLPRSLNKLINLRHLMTHGSELTSTLPDVGKLTSLQELQRFRVKNENGYGIDQLKHLNEIRESLIINNLENIENSNKAAEANLKDKKYVENLSFIWGHDNLNKHLEVLEGLEPHPNLKYLCIDGYKSAMYPSWMFRQGFLHNLSSLLLKDCPLLKVLPPISTLFPSLQELYINKLSKLTKLPVFPSSFKTLTIVECWSLVLTSEKELQKDAYKERFLMALQNCNFEFMLRTIPDMENRARRKLLTECSALKLMEWGSPNIIEDLSSLITNLEGNETRAENIWEANLCLLELRMDCIYSKKEKSPLVLPSDLKSLTIKSCYITDNALMNCLGQLTCLESLDLVGINTITELPPKEVLCQIVALNRLRISGCYCFISLAGLHALLSLKSLSIEDCPCLEMQGEGRGALPPSLDSLIIGNCDSLKHVEVKDLPLLYSAFFENCRQLKSLVLKNLSSLKQLQIRSCPELLELICSEMLVLGTLVVKECSNLLQIFSSDVLAWPSIKVIGIGSFSMLGELPSRGELVNLEILSITKSNEAFFNKDEFGCLTSLSEFDLNYSKVQALPCSIKNLSLLRRINLLDCYELLSLPDLPETMQYLSLKNCPAIALLPVLPKSLWELHICNCPNLKNRCREPNGEDWPKISHVGWRNIK